MYILDWFLIFKRTYLFTIIYVICRCPLLGCESSISVCYVFYQMKVLSLSRFSVCFLFFYFFLFCKCEDFSNIKTVLHSWDKLHLFNHILTFLYEIGFDLLYKCLHFLNLWLFWWKASNLYISRNLSISSLIKFINKFLYFIILLFLDL